MTNKKKPDALPNAFIDGLIKVEFGTKLRDFSRVFRDFNYTDVMVLQFREKISGAGTAGTAGTDRKDMIPPIIGVYNKELPDNKIRFTVMDEVQTVDFDEKTEKRGLGYFIKKTLYPIIDKAEKEGKFHNIDYDSMISEVLKKPSRNRFLAIHYFYNFNSKTLEAFIWLKKMCVFKNNNDFNEYRRWLRRGKVINFSGEYLSRKLGNELAPDKFRMSSKNSFWFETGF